MSLPFTNMRRLAALALVLAAPIAQAQTKQDLEERRLKYNEDRRKEIDRASAEGAAGASKLFDGPDAPAPPPGLKPDPATAARIDQARRDWQWQPPLAAERNRLLGRWKLDTTRKPTNLFEEVAGAFGAGPCAVLWGTKVWEFRPKQMLNGDAAAPDMVLDTEYRGNAQAVAVLPKEFFKLLVFEFVGPDRVRHADCDFVRVGAAATAGAGGAPATTAGARPGSIPGPTVAAAAPSAPPGASRAGCPGNFVDQLGRARLPEAQRALYARYPDVAFRTLANGHVQYHGSGNRCDDARLQGTVYEFDTAGVLQQVTLLWRRGNGPVPSPLFTERAAEMARSFRAPAPQTAGVLEAVVSGRRLVLKDLAPQGVLAEAYAVAP